MASELAVTLIRFGFLALLWIFIFLIVGIMRRDVFGTVVTSRGKGRQSNKRVPVEEEEIPFAAPRTGGLPQAAKPVRLVVTGGSLSGTSLPLGSAPIIIGRSPACTLVLDDSYASSQHARIYQSDGTWWVEDLRSTNGTFVGGERVVSPRQLGPGIQVRIGQTVLELTR